MTATRSDGSQSSRVYAYAPPLIVFALFLAIVSQVSDFYLSRLAALLAFWAALGMSWNLIGGYAGQLSLGHAAFVGLGGYVTLVLQQQFGIVPWIGLLASTLAAALAALVVGVTLRLSGIYFALGNAGLSADPASPLHLLGLSGGADSGPPRAAISLHAMAG